MTPDQIAAAVNKPRSTIYRWRKENPDLYQAAADYAAGMRAQRDRLREMLEIAVKDGEAGYVEWISCAQDALSETEEE